MKNNKPILFSAMIVALFAIATIAGCTKPNNNNNNGTDWASSLAGVYIHDIIVGGTTYHDVTTFTVTRKDNKAIYIKIDNPGAGSFIPAIHSCFDSVVLNTATTFTINETDSCSTQNFGQHVWDAGNGSFTPNSLTIMWVRLKSDPHPYDSTTYNFVATK